MPKFILTRHLLINYITLFRRPPIVRRAIMNKDENFYGILISIQLEQSGMLFASRVRRGNWKSYAPKLGSKMCVLGQLLLVFFADFGCQVHISLIMRPRSLNSTFPSSLFDDHRGFLCPSTADYWQGLAQPFYNAAELLHSSSLSFFFPVRFFSAML
jgi:hypothetical protein